MKEPMTSHAPQRPSIRRPQRLRLHRVTAAACVWGLLAWASPAAWATTPDTSITEPYRSSMDRSMFFQLLVGEIEAFGGRSDLAYEILFDAAKKSRDEALFKRAVQVAFQSRSLEKAQASVRAWRQALPQSKEALRYQLQLATGTGRMDDAVEPFNALLAIAEPKERVSLINALPQVLERGDKKAAATTFEPVLQKTAEQPGLRAASLATLGRLWAMAGDVGKAQSWVEQAHAADPRAKEPVALALELMASWAGAEKIVQNYLAQPTADPLVRLAYGQTLAQQQRMADALVALKQTTVDKPDLANGWLALGAVQLDVKQPADAEASLMRYLQALGAEPAAPAETALAGSAAAPKADANEEADNQRAVREAALANGRNQAYLMLSQAAEQRRDFTAASAWLERMDNDARGLDVVLRRASMLAKQGKVNEARALIKAVPVTTPDDARLKFIAESQMLRDVKRWQDAYDLLGDAAKQFPQDVDLVYEQAMMAEKLNRMDQMEKLLRQVIQAKPDHQNAYNALGYSLADRGVRLPEARQLVRKALDLAPGDPFITDSLGWIEFRLGNRSEAVRLLREAWSKRPDTEIGAHLGEALWVGGDKDEARKVWRDARNRDAGNDVLKETLQRLKVEL
jgi:tetratricopeptide (TPR) repeat protein